MGVSSVQKAGCRRENVNGLSFIESVSIRIGCLTSISTEFLTTPVFAGRFCPSFQDISFACRVLPFGYRESAASAHSPTRADTMLQDVLDLGPARLFGLARLLLSVQVLVGMVGCLAFVYGTM